MAKMVQRLRVCAGPNKKMFWGLAWVQIIIIQAIPRRISIVQAYVAIFWLL
jgi:hypothetical protein